MIYFESDYVNISWDPAIQAVIAVWNGYMGGSDKIQTGHGKIIELVKQQKAYKWLSDLSNLKVVDQSDQLWISTILTPLLIKVGIKFTAIVIPESPAARLSAKSVIKNLKEGEITRETFPDLEEAKTWLRSV